MASSSRLSLSQLSMSLLARVKSVLLAVSVFPVVTLSILIIVIAPGVIGMYPVDIVFWGSLILTLYIMFIAVGWLNYYLISNNKKLILIRREHFLNRSKLQKRAMLRSRVAFLWAQLIIVTLLLCHVWLHMTNPYAKFNVTEQPYITTVDRGVITVKKQFDLHAASGPFAEALGYYKSGFLIVQNSWFGSYKAPSHSADAIVDDIHKLRFDSSKPYLISGDQFSVLYPRNLGVFYNSLLDYRTAHSERDWENRQRIYLQSALYALDAFSAAKHITTTVVPVGPRTVALTQVHPGSIASDSLYGVLYAFDKLEYADKVQTVAATKKIITDRKADLNTLLDLYLQDVRDPATGLVKRGIHLASARDGALRDSSFYDNVILWKTLELADKLGIRAMGNDELGALRTKIMDTFWLEDAGYFKDDQSTTEYSSDWLIALPAGFLLTTDAEDEAKLARAIDYTKKQQLDKPFPIRYSVANDHVKAPWAVRKFVPNYGGDAIWSYWGAQYIYLLGVMYHQTGNESYLQDAEKFIAIYKEKIVQTRGFPETFDTEGNFLENPVYKSIRQTGWVVQFELAEAELKERDSSTK